MKVGDFLNPIILESVIIRNGAGNTLDKLICQLLIKCFKTRMGGSRGGRGSGRLHPGNNYWLYLSVKILVRTPSLGPIASRGRFVRNSENYIDD